MPSTYIKEVVLEDFMSYEYSRVPLKPGLNIITGPNGAGKSSIVLAIAVAMGQTYTERSRRLRDLIRRGKNVARVTVVFDNRPVNGKRPIPFSRKDEVRISRYLRSDGTYWFEMDYKPVDKAEVVYRLSRLGINPNNMLIIMHQGMVPEFSRLSPQERLRLVEEAAGLHEYRERILSASEKLEAIVSEEESLKELLSKSERTMGYWEEQYRRLLEKRELRKKLKELRLELAWSKWNLQLKNVEKIGARIAQRELEANKWKNRLNEAEKRVKEAREDLNRAWEYLEEAFIELSVEERALGRVEASSKESIKDAMKSVEAARAKVEALKSSFFEKQEELVEASVERAISEFRLKMIQSEISRLKRKLSEARQKLSELESEAKSLGPKVETERSPDEIIQEIRFTSARLSSLADVSDDTEQMYLNYSKMLEELKEKAKILAENKRAALEELEERSRLWRRKLRSLVNEVNRTFNEILERLDAKGEVRLIDLDDVEQAGLRIFVGYRGAPLAELDPFTQSGGERTTAIIAFLLALQRQMKSPIRVVDEFDVHMDPANRERVFEQIFEILKEAGGQSIFVTPRRLVGLKGGTHIIVVQNVAGTSRIREVS